MSLRPFPAWALALAAATLPAQEPGAAYLASLKTPPGARPRWTLVVTPEDRKDLSWQRDDTFSRLRATQEFQIEAPPPETQAALWKAQGWTPGASKWLLVSPEGLTQAEGTGRPKGPPTLETLQRNGWLPRWERREAFLREHPDHGEARLEALREAMTLTRVRIARLRSEGKLISLPTTPLSGPPGFSFGRLGDPEGDSLADSTLLEFSQSLGQFLAVPGALDEEWTTMVLAFLNSFIQGGQSARFRLEASRWMMLAKDRMREHPMDPNRQLQYFELASLLQMPMEGSLEGVVPVPSAPWPPDSLVWKLAEAYGKRGDWPGALAYVEGLIHPLPPFLTIDQSWALETGHRASLAQVRLHVLSHLKRWDEFAQALEEAHRLAGAGWNFNGDAISWFFGPDLQKHPELINRLTQPAGPDLPAPPKAPPLRLSLLGKPEWRTDWEQLKGSYPLQAWAPAELIWSSLSDQEIHRLKTQKAWDPETRWLLTRGPEVLASGATLPKPDQLADTLRGVAPSRLDRLTQAIQQAPDNLALRQARAEALLARMPNPHQEPLLVEDASRTFMPLPDPGPAWRPNPDLWSYAALKVLPALEQELRRWPGRAKTWKQWLSWSRFHPEHPSPLPLALGLTLWDHADWRTALPPEVHAAVAQELRRGGRFEAMRDWFQQAWQGLDQRLLNEAAETPMARTDLQKERQTASTPLYKPLREALVALRRDAEVVALDKAYALFIGLPPNRSAP